MYERINYKRHHGIKEVLDSKNSIESSAKDQVVQSSSSQDFNTPAKRCARIERVTSNKWNSPSFSEASAGSATAYKQCKRTISNLQNMEKCDVPRRESMVSQSQQNWIRQAFSCPNRRLHDSKAASSWKKRRRVNWAKVKILQAQRLLIVHL